MGFTENQKLAIKERDNNILISAAAGSGKTTVLSQRILSKIINDKINIDILLVVTFTDAAAEEMKERITKNIISELEKQPENDFLKEQVTRINKAQISTLDSFFSKVVKSNFKLVNIDPNFKIIKGEELKILELETLEIFFEEYYENSDLDFINIVNAFTKGSNDDYFIKIFLKIYNKSRNMINPTAWLENAYKNYSITSEEEYFKSDIFQEIIKYSKEYLAEILEMYENIKFISTNELDFENKYNIEKTAEKFIIEEFSQYENMIISINNGSYNIFMNELSNIKFARWNKRLFENSELGEQIKTLRDVCKTSIKNLQKKFFDKPVEQILKDNQIIYPILKNFCELIINYHEFFMRIKREKNCFAFHDITHFCLEILYNSEDGTPSQIANEYKKVFQEVIIDEYQDINDIQEAILSCISENNRFMVGDIKQCIYGFREANPNIFYEKFKLYFGNDKIGKRIDLNANFRSNEHVVNAINIIFENIMTEKFGSVNYDDNSKLYFNANFTEIPQNSNTLKSCELNIIDCSEEHIENLGYEKNKNNPNIQHLFELKSSEIEVHFVAQKIINLMENKFQILDNGNYRPIKYKDIVILMRARDKFDVFAKILSEYSIPTFTKSTSNFYDFIEVKTILNILKILDNPLQNLPLIAVMYSPVFNFTANELLRIRLSNDNTFLWNTILEFSNLGDNNSIEETEDNKINFELKNKLKNFINKITEWQMTSKSLAVNELLSFIYEDSNYYNYLGLTEDGEKRQANLLSLIEKYLDFSASGSHGLFSFICHADKLKSFEPEDDVSIFSEDEDVIKITTIHKSKGLEFPVVILSNLDKAFSIQDENNPILFHDDFSLGLSIYYENKEEKNEPRTQVTSIQKQVIKSAISDKKCSEEMRVLYVAMTRAKECLILTSSISSELSSYLKKLENLVIPSIGHTLHRHFIDSANSKKFLSIVYSMIKNFDTEKIWTVNEISAESILNKLPKNIEQHKANVTKTATFKQMISLNVNKENSNNIDFKKNLDWKYKNLILQNLQSAISVSEIKKIYNKSIFDEEKTIIFEDTLSFPEFYTQKNEVLTPADIGTIYHKVFENIDFDKFTEENLPSLFEYLLNQNLLSEKELNSIDKNKVLSFCKSDLVDRIKASNCVSRECVFTIGLKPSDIYSDEILENVNSNILVSGIMDLYFEENDYIVLVDYKSDSIKSDETFIKIYKPQLEIYKKALERATKKEVRECYIYSILGEKYILVF